MENAGCGIANAIQKRFEKGTVIILAGTGNNGGDSFVAARHLKEFNVRVLMLGGSKNIRTKEARRNWELLQEDSCVLRDVKDASQLNVDMLRDADVIVDAILGTGVEGAIKEPAYSAIDYINRCKKKIFILSVDVPSGMNPDTGDAEKCVSADLTVSFHKPKPGLLRKNVASMVGELEVVNIGISRIMEMTAGPGDLRLVLGRDPESHKGDNGRILIIGGGAYTGAPALAALSGTALSGLRAGADIVTIAAPKSVADVIASFSPNLIVRKMSANVLVKNDVPRLKKLIETHHVVALGMGLGTDKKTVEAVREIAPLCNKLVVDADALSMLQLPAKKGMIITPHGGEFEKISGKKLSGGLMSRCETVKTFSRKNRCVTLLKEKEDIISDGSRIKINRTGNAGMTVGGTGDVLAGITAALYAIHDDALRAAASAAFISGVAGDLAFDEMGYGFTATDVVDKIPLAVKESMGMFDSF